LSSYGNVANHVANVRNSGVSVDVRRNTQTALTRVDSTDTNPCANLLPMTGGQEVVVQSRQPDSNLN
jgi:hypothetical protein